MAHTAETVKFTVVYDPRQNLYILYQDEVPLFPETHRSYAAAAASAQGFCEKMTESWENGGETVFIPEIRTAKLMFE